MSKLNIKLLRDKPHKIYSVNVEIDYHVEELYKFLNKHKDRELEIVLNGKKIKFNSIASRKRFAQGFRESGRIIFGHARDFTAQSQKNINRLSNEITQHKKEVATLQEESDILKGRVRTYRIVQQIRMLAYQDSTEEYREALEILKDRLDKIEPVIKMIRRATSEGELNKAHIRVKKEKL